MPTSHEGIDSAGRPTCGRREAESEKEPLAALNGGGHSDVAAQASLFVLPTLNRRPSRKDVALFTRMLASLISSTGNPAEALGLLQRLTRSPALRAVVRQVALEVHAGVSVADALARHPSVFTRSYVNAVRAGEETGKLTQMLERLSEQLTRAEAIRAKTRAAMVYPCAVLAMALCTGWYMLRNIVPTFAGILARSSRPIPPSTRVLLNLSTLLQQHGMMVLCGAAVATVMAIRASRDRHVQDWAGAHVARIPVFGDLISASAMANFCGMFGLVLETGIDVVQALAMAAETIPNARIGRMVATAIPEVAEGGSVSGALERTRAVPALVPTIAEVGERTGTLSQQMKRAGADYFRDHEQLSQLASTATEVIFISLVAVGIGAMVVTLWIPLFESTRAMGH